MSSELVPYERFEEYRQKRNRLRRIRPAKSSSVEAHDEREAVAVAAVAVRRPGTSGELPQEFTD